MIVATTLGGTLYDIYESYFADDCGVDDDFRGDVFDSERMGSDGD